MSTQVSALELEAATYLSTSHSNNTFRSDFDETGNLETEPGISLNGLHRGANLQAAINYNFGRRFQSEDQNTERNFSQGSASIDWQALPQRLDFNLTQTSQESTSNLSQNGAPNDKGTTHNLSVGPTLYFRPRGADQLRFTYVYEDTSSNFDDEDSSEDSSSDVFSGSYIVQLTESTSITAEHREETTSFTSGFASDLDATKQSLSYSYTNDSSVFELTGGYSEYEREGAETIDGGTGELIWQKEFDSYSVSLFGRRDITNQSSRLYDNIGFDRDEFDLFIDNNIAEVATETGYGFTVTKDIGATQLQFSAESFRYDYEELTADTDEYSITIGASRSINRNMTLNIAGQYSYFETDDLPGTPAAAAPARIGNTRKLYSINSSFNWTVTSNLNLSAGWEYRTETNGFDDMITSARISYTLFRRNY